jgi:RimJ/RimL family protein N-acetyltransferase
MFSDPEVQRWNPAPKVVDLASAADWLERSAAWEAAWAVWSIVDHEGRFVGTSLLWNMDRSDHMNGSVGYRIAPSARRQGVATAAVRAMTEFAFDRVGLARIELVHTVANIGSCRVAERSGFTLEGTLRSEYRTFDGQRWDSHLHSLLATDPRPGAA